MVQEVAFEQEKVLKSPWGGGKSPFGVSREKFTMWIFILSDAFTFAGLLAGYGFFKGKFT
ncbi:hypothetical protein JGI9_00187 [Candidatus Kryptonium thompsonii]|nr:hypothetical protein JGI9_00187 [Candidatus Kryptonium thompsoni]